MSSNLQTIVFILIALAWRIKEYYLPSMSYSISTMTTIQYGGSVYQTIAAWTDDNWRSCDISYQNSNTKEINSITSSNGEHRVCDDVIFEVEENYEIIKPLGRGYYGVVCSAIDTATDEKYAIKKVTNVLVNSVEGLKVFRELKILRYVRNHENVISLKRVMIPSSKHTFKDIYMVFELMDYNLETVIQSKPLSNEVIKYFMLQFLRGLSYVHSANIVHTDLKPDNVLVNENNDLKISDFGLAITTKDQAQPRTGSLGNIRYRAPELLLKCDTYGASIDVWSAGCIFAELLGRKQLFSGNNDLDQLNQIINIIGTQDYSDLDFKSRSLTLLESLPYTKGIGLRRMFPNASIKALDLLRRMLTFDPNKRITAEEALKHPYLAGFYDSELAHRAPFPCDVDADEWDGVTKIRDLIYDEMMLYRHGTVPYRL